MKRILITGANSYIGMSFEKYINNNYPDDYIVDTIDMIDGSWREKNFAGYDSVFHVAGIVHKKETKKNAHLYYEVNRDLTIKVAQKAKMESVKHFVYLSTMSVYGLVEGEINPATTPNPNTHYGKSKLQAEQAILSLRDEMFSVTVVRPPMVYGDGCKGNYQSLVRLANTLPVFPDFPNRRSAIHIDRLCSFLVKYMTDRIAFDDILFPQDSEYMCTCRIVKDLALSMNKNIKLLKVLNPIPVFLKRFTLKGRKAFGDLIYVDMRS